MQTSPRSTLLVTALAARSVRPSAEKKSPALIPHSALRDPTYGCVDWYGYAAADEKRAADDPRR